MGIISNETFEKLLITSDITDAHMSKQMHVILQKIQGTMIPAFKNQKILLKNIELMEAQNTMMANGG